ncbi:uncharacterized protein [Equus przewalskii]|uniref:Uncharacterized protein n=1 Tax=Equus przewalskii TaxID=9798 RepID=A0ABM4L2H6_EQUPR
MNGHQVWDSLGSEGEISMNIRRLTALEKKMGFDLLGESDCTELMVHRESFMRQASSMRGLITLYYSDRFGTAFSALSVEPLSIQGAAFLSSSCLPFLPARLRGSRAPCSPPGTADSSFRSSLTCRKRSRFTPRRITLQSRISESPHLLPAGSCLVKGTSCTRLLRARHNIQGGTGSIKMMCLLPTGCVCSPNRHDGYRTSLKSIKHHIEYDYFQNNQG